MQNHHFTININPNKSHILDPSENIIANVSFHSVALEKKAKLINNQDLFSQKWVLNKLIEMECEKIEDMKNSISEIHQNQQPKEELLSICLDIMTNQSFNQKEKSILGKLYEESKDFLKTSIKSLNFDDKNSPKTNPHELLSKSFNWTKEKDLKEGNSRNKSLIIQKNPIFEMKNECELILFSESSIVEQIKNSKIKSRETMQTNNLTTHNEINFSQQKIELKQNNIDNFSPLQIKNSKKEQDFILELKKPQNNSFLSNKSNKIQKSSSFSGSETSPNVIMRHNENFNQNPFYKKKKHRFRKILKSPEKNRNSTEFRPEIIIKEGSLKRNLEKTTKANEDDSNLKCCEICFDVLPVYKQLKAGKCDDVFCKDCMKLHLIESIKIGRVLEIPCPKEGCKHKYTDDEIKHVLKNYPDIIKKYEKFKLQISLSKNPNIRWCIRPDCDNYMIGTPDKPKLTCSCGEIICFLCSRRWHEGKTCVELMDLEYESYRTKMNIIDCPKCKSRIEKISGCNHMTCTRCRYEFCWVCGGKYSKRHFRKLNIFGCPGMMYQVVRRDKNLKKKLFCAKIFTLFKILATVILFLLLPIIGVLFLFGIPNFIYFKYRRPTCNFTNVCKFSMLLFLGIIISPILLILFIIPGSCLWIIINRRGFMHGVGRRRRR